MRRAAVYLFGGWSLAVVYAIPWAWALGVVSDRPDAWFAVWLLHLVALVGCGAEMVEGRGDA